jgi:exonuclease VII small subunit
LILTKVARNFPTPSQSSYIEQGTSAEELAQVEEQIKTAQEALNQVVPQFEQQKELEESCNSQLRINEQRRTELYAKKGWDLGNF